MKGYNICNVNLLYLICLISILNIIWFAFYNKRCILIFLCCCLAIYIINKNMIFVLGISLILVDSLYLFNLVKKEGFLGDENDTSNLLDTNDTNYENDISNNLLDTNDTNYENDTSNNLLDTNDENDTSNNNEMFTNTINTISDEENDEALNYMHDKSIIKKLKHLTPNMIDMLANMNSVHIKELNETINNLTDRLDP